MSTLQQVAAGVLALLVVASLATALLRQLRPGADLQNVVDRIRAWWAMAGLFLAVVWLNNWVSVVFFAFVSYWALKEYITLLRTRPADHYGLLLAFCAVPLQYLWVGTGWYGMFIVFVPVWVFLALGAWQVLAADTRGFVAATAQIHWGLMVFVFGLSHLGWLLRMPESGTTGATGATLLVWLVLVIELGDVLQYLWGKALGRTPILPEVSPNKTWEGLLGGLACATALGVLLRGLTPFGWIEATVVAFLAVIAGFFGGAVMSSVKRDLGVKDFGTLIPGHGGMVDRVDSLCFAAPLFLHWVRYYHYA